jgi:hypothetical protein
MVRFQISKIWRAIVIETTRNRSEEQLLLDDMSSLALFDTEAADGFSDGENEEPQEAEQLKSNKRGVLDLGNFDEEDEIEMLKTGADEEMLKKKVKKKRRVFNEEMLTSASGLERIYEGFPGAVKMGAAGSEKASLAKLIAKYKAWAFQIYPNLAFQDLMGRCESLGAKAHVRGYMETMRERERNRYLRDAMGVAPEDIIMSSSLKIGHDADADGFGATTSPEAGESPAPWDRPAAAASSSGSSSSSSSSAGAPAGLSLEDEEEMEYDWGAIDAIAAGTSNTEQQQQPVSTEPSDDQLALEEFLQGGADLGDANANNYSDHSDDEEEAMAAMHEMEQAEQQQQKQQQQQQQKTAASVAAAPAGASKGAVEEGEGEAEVDLGDSDEEEQATQPQAQ